MSLLAAIGRIPHHSRIGRGPQGPGYVRPSLLACARVDMCRSGKSLSPAAPTGLSVVDDAALEIKDVRLGQSPYPVNGADGRGQVPTVTCASGVQLNALKVTPSVLPSNWMVPTHVPVSWNETPP